MSDLRFRCLALLTRPSPTENKKDLQSSGESIERKGKTALLFCNVLSFTLSLEPSTRATVGLSVIIPWNAFLSCELPARESGTGRVSSRAGGYGGGVKYYTTTRLSRAFARLAVSLRNGSPFGAWSNSLRGARYYLLDPRSLWQ